MMITNYTPEKLRTLRMRALLTQREASRLSGVMQCTISKYENKQRRFQSGTLQKLLNLYAIQIKRLEAYDSLWGEDGTKGETKESNGNKQKESNSSSLSRTPRMANGNGTSTQADRAKSAPRPSR